MAVSLWREAAASDVLQVGANVRVSHLRTNQTQFGTQLQSTNFTSIEVGLLWLFVFFMK